MGRPSLKITEDNDEEVRALDRPTDYSRRSPLYRRVSTGGPRRRPIRRCTPATSETPVETGYAPVNGLQMYYEIQGSGGVPLVILHGAFGTVDMFGPLVPALAETRQVITVELQGHGRTADIDRPFTYRAIADDVAALLQYLGIEQVDVFGYSMGGFTAQQVAIRHPELVRKLVIASASFNREGVYPEVWEGIESLTPELFAGSPPQTEYARLAPNPEDWPTLIEKVKQMEQSFTGWPAEDVRGDRGANAADRGRCRYSASPSTCCGDVSPAWRRGAWRFWPVCRMLSLPCFPAPTMWTSCCAPTGCSR